MASPALLPAVAAISGMLFGLLIATSTRASTRLAAGAGGPALAAVVYGSFSARLLATAIFFALLVRLWQPGAAAAAVGFAVAMVCVPAATLARAAYPKRRKGGR